jgi:hypothetical protein
LALVGLAPAVAGAAPLASIDFNDRTPTDGSLTDSGTQPGFGAYLMGTTGGTASVTDVAGVTQTVNGYTINVAPIVTYPAGGGSGIMDDRDRNFSLPAGATTTNVEVYDDFVFNNSNTGGLHLTVSGGDLQADTQYLISIYAYDHGSATVTRTANWVDRNNSDAPVLSTAFLGGVVPVTNDTNKFTGLATTDANGVLSLVGINTTSLSPTTGLPGAQGVFINGLEISPVPEPAATAFLMGLAALAVSRRRR